MSWITKLFLAKGTCAAGLVLAAPAICVASEGEQRNVFAGNLGNVIWTVLIFVILLWILKRYAWGPMLDALQRREQFIEETIENAQKQKTEAEQLLAEYREQLAGARQDGQAVVEQARKDAEDARQRLHAQARDEADGMIQRARQEITMAEQSALRDLQNVAADLAVGVATKIIKRELSDRDHRGLIEESMAELTGRNDEGGQG